MDGGGLLDLDDARRLGDGELVSLRLGERWVDGAFVRNAGLEYVTTIDNLTFALSLAVRLGLRRR
jgi:hypothetical protein